MARVYTQEKRFELKEVGLAIQNVTAEERCLIKAEAFAQIPLEDFSLNGYDIEILEAPSVEDDLLRVSVKATKDGIELPINNPLLFRDPPIMVNDGTYYQVTDPEMGVMIDNPNCVEDLETALKEMIVGTIASIAFK